MARSITASGATQLSRVQEHEHFSEVDVLLREDGGRQVHPRKKFGHSRKCCPSCAGRFLECLVSWRDHRHSGIRQVLFSIEERAHVCALLSKGIPVVLDFPGNTKVQRAWFRELIERANVEHELHFVDASDALCKSQLRERSIGLLAGTLWTRDADFEAITAYFQPPSEDENFNVVRHERV
jgi:AAA domain